jgi:hypothetical protein
MSVVDPDAAEAFVTVASRKVAAAEECLRYRAYGTARERLEEGARAIQRALAELEGA